MIIFALRWKSTTGSFTKNYYFVSNIKWHADKPFFFFYECNTYTEKNKKFKTAYEQTFTKFFFYRKYLQLLSSHEDHPNGKLFLTGDTLSSSFVSQTPGRSTFKLGQGSVSARRLNFTSYGKNEDRQSCLFLSFIHKSRAGTPFSEICLLYEVYYAFWCELGRGWLWY